MYPLQSTTIEAGFALAAPLGDDWPRSKASSLRGHDAALPTESVRHALRVTQKLQMTVGP